MRLLIIEDEIAIANQLQDYFEQQDFVIDTAHDGKEGQYLAHEYPYDLAIIDLGLPNVSGMDIIRSLREKNISYPILILTARGNWQDKVEGLEAGADDYLVKPFHTEELRARANALIRRAAGNASATLKYGDICIETAKKVVLINNNEIDLTSYEYNTFEYLALHANKTVSKTELTEHLYHQDYERDSNVIEVFVGRLRKKLDPDNSLNIIKTIRGQGYRFNLTID